MDFALRKHHFVGTNCDLAVFVCFHFYQLVKSVTCIGYAYETTKSRCWYQQTFFETRLCASAIYVQL
jgi:hypothetical protein